MRELARIFEFAPPPLLPEIAQFAAFLRGDGSSPDLRAAGVLTSHAAAICRFQCGSALGNPVPGGVIRYGPAQQCWGLALPSRSFGVYMAKVVQRCCSQIGCGSIHINLRINHMMADKHVTEAAIACVKSQFICRLRTPKCVPLHALNLVASFRRDVHLTILAPFVDLHALELAKLCGLTLVSRSELLAQASNNAISKSSKNLSKNGSQILRTDLCEIG
eukprot:CAMPEP_0115293620 /NCGR_PEP_ID=MMETSP0270-20121206/65754_1 /TAXON_ID=71861 /ORGANISM="Scrippsiella trochoidea, Strain CCMP3099" /LENGTH=218 /DNA_ID=CAMNT_0002711107 /DNA_START=287 /DNA_END=944 /DNA_ORIENTATION=+